MLCDGCFITHHSSLFRCASFFEPFVGGRRRSTRDFFSDINTAILQMETMVEGAADTWALTLATATEDPSLCMDMDVVFIGHVDGYVHALFCSVLFCSVLFC